jgi:phosphatidate cytidylyltransferase
VGLSALQQRTLTALVLAPLVAMGVLLLDTPHLALLFGLIVLYAAWEWTMLAGVSRSIHRVAYLAFMTALFILLWLAPLDRWTHYLLIPIVVWWLGLGAYVCRLRAIEASCTPRLGLLPVGILVLTGPWLAIVYLHRLYDAGPWLVLFLLVLIWTADTAAYFSGRLWGRVKLAPLISPGKTWVGVYGALLAAALCGPVLMWMLGLSLGWGLVAVVVCVLTAVVSVVGDLYESLLKRRRGLKDSGHLLPGHGGVLDRIDSLTAAAPVFTLGVLWLEAQL